MAKRKWHLTESEWMECKNLDDLLDFLHRINYPKWKRDFVQNWNERKQRLLMCACCRRNLPNFSPKDLQVLEWGELMADGKIEDSATIENQSAVEWVEAGECYQSSLNLIGVTDAIINNGLARVASEIASKVIESEPTKNWKHVRQHEEEEQCRLIREIVGNPFHHVKVDPSWLTPGVLDMAQSIYDERQYETMPILGDRLEENGCTDEYLLNHCRQEEEHVRGCWVIDLLLGRN